MYGSLFLSLLLKCYNMSTKPSLLGLQTEMDSALSLPLKIYSENQIKQMKSYTK